MERIIRRYIAQGDALKVKYLGGTIEGSLTEGKEYIAAYITEESDKGNVYRYERFKVLDDSKHYCTYNNAKFEVLEESINKEIWNDTIIDYSDIED